MPKFLRVRGKDGSAQKRTGKNAYYDQEKRDAGLLCQVKPFLEVGGEEDQGDGQGDSQFAEGHSQLFIHGDKREIANDNTNKITEENGTEQTGSL